MQFIADTGFIAGFWDKSDRLRAWTRKMAEAHPGPHLTCEPALMEAAYLVGPQRVARALAGGDYVVPFHWEHHREAVLELVERYADRQMEITDACLVVLAELNPNLKILTCDRADFSVYRTRKGKPLRCEFPPA